MTPSAPHRSLPVVGLAILAATVHLFPNGAYGLFRDELYFIACAKRLAWGYVDHPPFSIAILALNRALFGESILAMRWIPATLAGATVLLTAAMAVRLGGGRRAAFLAALATAFAPFFISFFDFYSMNAIEAFLWTAIAALVVEILDGGDDRLWLAVGTVIGIGLLNKHTTVALGVALVAGLLATRARSQLRRRAPWIGAAIAFAILLPNLVWQHANGWPGLEFYRNAMLHKNVDTNPALSLFIQAVATNLGALPLTLGGLWFLLRAPAGRPWRALGVAYLVLLAAHLISRSSRPDRIAGFYPVVFAAGAVAFEAGRSWVRRFAVPAVAVATVAFGLAFLPVGSSAFPPEVTARYTQVLGRLLQVERGNTARLPQWLADRAEWDRIAGQVADVVDRLPAGERDRTRVYAENYGEAGALELYGAARGLPPVICNHNSYFLWSRERLDGDVLVALGANRADLALLYDQVEEVGTTRCSWCLDHENGRAILVARHPKASLRAFWEEIPDYD